MRNKKTVIHVNQHVLKYNKKHGTKLPVFTIKQGKTNTKTNRILIHGNSQLIYSPDKPLKCGAHAWLSTYGDVIACD